MRDFGQVTSDFQSLGSLLEIIPPVIYANLWIIPISVLVLQREDYNYLPVILRNPELYIAIIYVQGMVTLIEHNQKNSFLIRASYIRYNQSNINKDRYYFWELYTHFGGYSMGDEEPPLRQLVIS